MEINTIIWLDSIVETIIVKHQTMPEEVEEVFLNEPYFTFMENGHQQNENVYAALGQTDGGRYLSIFFIYKLNHDALILSAREMRKKEKKNMASKKTSTTSISNASSYEEIGEFWDSHDVTDFEKETYDVEFNVHLTAHHVAIDTLGICDLER